MFIYYLFSSNSSFKLDINKSFLAFIIFIFLSSLSFFTIINTTEYLIELSRLLILLSSFIIFIIILSYFKFSYFDFSKGVLFFLSFELLYFFCALFYSHYYFNNLILYGFTSNVNIQAFSIIIKIPIILFSLKFFTNVFIRYLSYISLILSVSALFLISSRASFSISFIIIALFFSCIQFKEFFSNFKIVSKLSYSWLYYLLILF